jgi:hypothetical protein
MNDHPAEADRDRLAVSLIFLTQIAGNGTGTKLRERPIMRRVFFALALTSLVTCNAFAGDAPNADPNGPQEVRKPSPPAQIRPKNNKQVSKARSHERSGLRALAPAAAYASEQSVNLPISSAPKSTPPSTHTWTGFYVGAGAGVGSTQP